MDNETLERALAKLTKVAGLQQDQIDSLRVLVNVLGTEHRPRDQCSEINEIDSSLNSEEHG